jgi:hypothetical protein
VLDVSANALARARERLGEAAARVTWIEADVTARWPLQPLDVWHDRAVFHFLVDPGDRLRYVARLLERVKPGGAAIFATFGPAGPPMCSGLPVERYSPQALTQQLGSSFRFEEALRELHATPHGSTQEFWYSRFTIV